MKYLLFACSFCFLSCAMEEKKQQTPVNSQDASYEVVRGPVTILSDEGYPVKTYMTYLAKKVETQTEKKGLR